MRAPATAAVNVIMKEDTAANFDVAKNRGIEDFCFAPGHGCRFACAVAFLVSRDKLRAWKRLLRLGVFCLRNKTEQG